MSSEYSNAATKRLASNCPICAFPTDISSTLRVKVPTLWSDGKSNAALICSNCRTCILQDETVKNAEGLPELGTATYNACPCSGEQPVEFHLSLEKNRTHPLCGVLKMKCSVCGKEHNFLSDEEEKAEEVMQIALLQSPPPGPTEPPSYDDRTRFGYIGGPSLVKGAYNYPSTAPVVTPLTPGAHTCQTGVIVPVHPGAGGAISGQQSTQSGYPSHPTVAGALENSWLFPTGFTIGNSGAAPWQNVDVHSIWLNMLKDAENNDSCCRYCMDPNKQQSFFNDSGYVSHVMCTACGTRTNWSIGDGKTTPKTLVTDLAILLPGDHIAWHRPCAIWHHAILFDTDLKYKQIEVIHYTGGFERQDGAFASIRREWIPVNVVDRDLFRMDYKESECYPPTVVMAKACQRLHEAEYNPFTHNCEHFARWCKTGHERSVQIERIPIRIKKAADKLAERITSQAWFKNATTVIYDGGKAIESGEQGATNVDSAHGSSLSEKFNDFQDSVRRITGRFWFK